MRTHRVVGGTLLTAGTLLVTAVLTLGFTSVAYSWETTGQLRVMKTDNVGAPLIGAGFTLDSVGKDGNPGSATAWSCLISAVQGGVAACSTSDQVTPGTYWVVETTVPAGFGAGPPQKVTIAKELVTTVTFQDAPLPGSVVVTKVDRAGQPLVGAGFTLYADAAGAPGASTGKSCRNTSVVGGVATCTVSAVATGTYWVEETTVPSGYAGAVPQQVKVASAKAAALTFVDTTTPPSTTTTTKPPNTTTTTSTTSTSTTTSTTAPASPTTTATTTVPNPPTGPSGATTTAPKAPSATSTTTTATTLLGGRRTPVSGAASVHTGVAFAGSRPLVIALTILGLAMMGAGVALWRRAARFDA